jgi:7-keto-8-aminopelargonate synthetase-like enzyme
MEPPTPIHRFRNNAAAVRHGNPAWEVAREHGLIDLWVTRAGEDRLCDRAGHDFVNLCSCSYLGLHDHPAILEGAIEAIRRAGTMDLPISRVRIALSLLDEMEADLSDLFRARAISAVTASAASAGVLPLIASGHLCPDGEPRAMVFDRFCHFSMHLMKPICADETTVLTAPHNDLDFVEDACKKHRRVAYVCDGVYSTGGCAPVSELLALQDRYGLFVYFDDSHSLSVHGERGQGYVRSLMDEMNPLTVIVASLCKGFGASGGVILLGPADREPILARFGGPLAWSQGINVPGIGAVQASARLHRTPELARLQQALRQNTELFDSLVATEQRGDAFFVRLIPVAEEQRALTGSRELLDRGFYTSAVFFPIVEKGKAGLRVMVRADNRPEDLRAFCAAVEEVLHGTEPRARAAGGSS